MRLVDAAVAENVSANASGAANATPVDPRLSWGEFSAHEEEVFGDRIAFITISPEPKDANGTDPQLTFDCRATEPPGGLTGAAREEGVLLVHGFAEFSYVYDGLLVALAEEVGVRALACNMRGYSRGARPAAADAYAPELLIDDMRALADAHGLRRLHLIGHDVGATLCWVALGTAEWAAERVLSFTSLSAPHPAALGPALYGPSADLAQQVAAQRLTVLSEPGAASAAGDSLFTALVTQAPPTIDPHYGGWATATQFQHALDWYSNGGLYASAAAAAAGSAAPPPARAWLPLPPKMGVDQLIGAGASSDTVVMRMLFDGDPNDGAPAGATVPNVSVPTLFVCGKDDSDTLCTRAIALETGRRCLGSYESLRVPRCNQSLPAGCETAGANAVVERAVVAHIRRFRELRGGVDAPADGAEPPSPLLEGGLSPEHDFAYGATEKGLSQRRGRRPHRLRQRGRRAPAQAAQAAQAAP